MAEALYRKYRPQVFGDVVGQEHIERTLKNAIDGNRVSHAYLFTGPRGTGKTTTARLLAKALLCEHGPTSNPCSTCEDCGLIAAGTHPDVYELDAASRTGVDNVREEIIGRVQYAPTRGRSKIYIVDEVHMLSTAAFNALLKTLEEPPSHVVFILCTTDPQKVPETIRSRCQRFDFRRISPENIISRLGAICVAEDVQFEGEALDLIAQRADGGMRDALTSLEQLITYGGGSVTLAEAELLLGSLDADEMAEIVEAIGRRDAAAGFRWVSRYVETGADLAQFTQDLVERMRNLYIYTILGSDACVAVGEVERRQIVQELPLFGSDRLVYILGVLGDLQKDMKTSANLRLSFEIALARMARPATDLTLEALAARIETLEQLSQTQPFIEQDKGTGHLSCRDKTNDLSPCLAASDSQACYSSQIKDQSPCPAPVGRLGVDGADCSVSEPSDVSSAPSEFAQASSVDMSNNAALQRAWQHVMAAVKKEKTAYGVLFLNTRARNDGGRLIIEFAAESDFAFRAVQKPDVDEVLARAIRQVFAADIPYSFTQGSSPASKGPTRSIASNGESSAVPTYTPAPVFDSASAEVSPASDSSQPVFQDSPEQELSGRQLEPQSDLQPDSQQGFKSESQQEVQSNSQQGFQQESEQEPQLKSEPEPWQELQQEPEPEFQQDFQQGSHESVDNGVSELQDALSLFGAVKIEEIN